MYIPTNPNTPIVSNEVSIREIDLMARSCDLKPYT